jgi:hypothetical protein
MLTGADMEKKHAHSVDFVMFNGDHELQMDGRSPRSNGVAFMCLQYGMEEVAKHPVPEGKFVKVACVHKSVPRIIE